MATDALELGIDIGALDAAISVTFPGTVASLRQQWGRAGRRGSGLAVYVAGEDALDQFFCRHPDEFLDRPVEAAILDHESQDIHLQHLLCAAHEGPLDDADAEFLGPRWRGYAELLESRGELVQRRGAFALRHPEDYPAARVSLRSASGDAFAIVEAESGEVMGTVEAARAFSTAHEGAIYLHLGRSYAVEGLDLEGRAAFVAPFSGNYYTQPKRESATDIERLLGRREALGVTLSFGTVAVTEQVIGYQRKRLVDHEVLDFNALDLPETTFTHPGAVVRAARRAHRRPAARRPARLAARRGAQPDRRAAAAGHVRPLGHRRPVDELPPPDRARHDLHLRRPPGRRRHLAPRLRGVRAPGDRRPPPDRRVPVPQRLPLVRAVAQVRQPQRAAVQGGRARADGDDARR